MSAAAKIATALKKHGRSMTLRRRIGTTTTYNDVSVKGTTKGYKPAELLGGLQQGDRYVTISHEEIAGKPWPGPQVESPKKGDFLIIDGTTTAVLGVETKYLKTDILAHVLSVRG
jgi:hypothetical protein